MKSDVVTPEETGPAPEVDVKAINIAAAKLCGWKFEWVRGEYRAKSPYDSKYAMIHPTTGEEQHPHPDYWNDARDLSDLWAAVEAFGGHPAFYNRAAFGYWLSRLVLGIEFKTTQCLYAFSMATAPPRFHVEAALRTCGQWPVKGDAGE